jgi:hypothetical protein
MLNFIYQLWKYAQTLVLIEFDSFGAQLANLIKNRPQISNFYIPGYVKGI